MATRSRTRSGTLTYLGAFALVVLASKRAEAGLWLGGLAVGSRDRAIALAARFEPSIFGNPDADLAADLPASLGRLSYPIGYWNGLAAVMAAGIVLLTWFGTTGGARRRGWRRSPRSRPSCWRSG